MENKPYELEKGLILYQGITENYAIVLQKIPFTDQEKYSMLEIKKLGNSWIADVNSHSLEEIINKINGYELSELNETSFNWIKKRIEKEDDLFHVREVLNANHITNLLKDSAYVDSIYEQKNKKEDEYIGPEDLGSGC